MAITRTPMVDDDGTGTTGTVINNAWKQQFYDQIDAAVGAGGTLGAWVDIPYNAANFTAGTGLWTVEAGDQLTLGYAINGKLATVLFHLETTTITVQTSFLQITLPAALTAFRRCRIPYVNYGPTAIGMAELTQNLARIQLYTWPSPTGFAPVTNGHYAYGSITFPIV